MPFYPWYFRRNYNRNEPDSILNGIWHRAGKKSLTDFFRLVAETNPQQAVTLINDEHVSFPVLYILKPVIEEYGLTSSLNWRNAEAFDFINSFSYMDHDRDYSEDLENISVYDYKKLEPSTYKWMVETGIPEDGLDERFDEILDKAVIILLREINDTSVSKVVTNLIFRRNRRDSYFHDLVWALFESTREGCLKDIAVYLCSPYRKNVELARKLLNIVPFEKVGSRSGALEEYVFCAEWLDKNKDRLIYTGESFQQSPDPHPFKVAAADDTRGDTGTGLQPGGCC